eukprot:SM000275S10318  [mRNA]  locus=s275:25532:27539:- [translate_table: standard]
MTSEQRTAEDLSIQKAVLESSWFRSSGRLCAYIYCAALREVDTSAVLTEMLQAGRPRSLYVPRIEDKESHMRMLRITNLTSDVEANSSNSMKILEPKLKDSSGAPREDAMQAEEPLDLVLMPGLAFDKSGGRLGRGGGYYDLFLHNYHERARSKGWTRPLCVALAYSVQVLEEAVPMDASDALVDGFVTAAGIVVTPGGRLDRSGGSEPS